MSPGSRNAPLIISFARHKGIKKWIIPDERAAGFMASGIAQQTKSPVVLCCTSGTALLNYAPAIAEVFYRELPLIVLSADRPPELIDQRDGQTIRQFEALKNHVKSSAQLPVIIHESDAEEYGNSLTSILEKSLALPVGPVHINIPFKEPFYPGNGDELNYNEVEIVKEETKDSAEHVDFDLSAYSKILILIGQQSLNPDLDKKLSVISGKIPVLKFPLNNLSDGIRHSDLFISNQRELKPELLISHGLSILSKKLKSFLRENKPRKHLHFDPAGVKIDTFQSNPVTVRDSFVQFLESYDFRNADKDFRNLWKSFEEKTILGLNDFTSQAKFSESIAAKTILRSIPKDSNLHLGNSMPVRYADIFDVPEGIECFSNRGTSGIDGCTSTAIGSAFVSDKLNILITGDLSFLYDRNAFFHNYPVPNFRVIILNNQGGGIFRLIDDPANLPELEEYFETRHNRTAEYICAENKLPYYRVDNLSRLIECISSFYEPSGTAKVLEVFTNPETNQQVYKELKYHINERIKN